MHSSRSARVDPYDTIDVEDENYDEEEDEEEEDLLETVDEGPRRHGTIMDGYVRHPKAAKRYLHKKNRKVQSRENKKRVTNADQTRLYHVQEHVRQLLRPYRENTGASKSLLPGAPTIKRFLAKVQGTKGNVDHGELRRCLFSLGLSAEDTAFLLDHLDPYSQGYVEYRVFERAFLAAAKPHDPAVDLTRIKAFHQKVVDRISANAGNLKDAFRNFDADRRGSLNYSQFRALLRENGFAGPEVEKLIYFLDCSGTQFVTFNAFTSGVDVSQEHSYANGPTSSSVQLMPMVNGGGGGGGGGARASAGAQMSSTLFAKKRLSGYSKQVKEKNQMDVMEEIRGLFRQRVMGKSKSIREVYNEFDSNGNGVLDYDEFKRFMMHYGFDEKQAILTIDVLDGDRSGTVDYDEFAAGLLFYRAPPVAALKATANAKRVEHPKPQELLELVRSKLAHKLMMLPGQKIDLQAEFDKCDVEGKRSLDYQEFGAFLVSIGVKLTPEEMKLMLKLVDRDHSGTIEFEEFEMLFGDKPLVPVNKSSLPTLPLPLHEFQLQWISRVLRSGRAVEEIFHQFDDDDNGELDHEEFRNFMRHYGINHEHEIGELIKVLDTDQSDRISYDEFTKVFNPMRLKARMEGGMCYTNFGDDDKTVSSQKSNKLNQDYWRRKLAYIDPQEIKTRMTLLGDLEVVWMEEVLDHFSTLEDAFKTFDRNGDDLLEYEEFRDLMAQYGITDETNLCLLLRKMDLDGTGHITLKDFSRIFNPKRMSRKAQSNANDEAGKTQKTIKMEQRNGEKAALRGLMEDKRHSLAHLEQMEAKWVKEVFKRGISVKEAFQQYDSDLSGELEAEEFRRLMKAFGVTSEQDIALLLQRMDKNGSGSVTYDEFKHVFNTTKLQTSSAKPMSNGRGSSFRGSKKISGPLPAMVGPAAAKSSSHVRNLEARWVKSVLNNYESPENAFDDFDADKTGELSYDEFASLVRHHGISRVEDVNALFRRLSSDGTERITLDEYMHAFRGHSGNGPVEVRSKATRTGGSGPTAASLAATTTTTSMIKTAPTQPNAPALRDLELRWIKNVLSCHGSTEAAFHDYDTDNSGELDHEEFASMLKRYGITRNEDIAAFIKRLDTNGSGTIDFQEFNNLFNRARFETSNRSIFLDLGGDDDQVFTGEELESVLEVEREVAQRIAQDTRDMRSAFRRFDINGSGRLEYKEFRSVLKGYKITEPEIRKVIRHLDKTVVGFIDYKEFISLFQISQKGATGVDGKKVHVERAKAKQRLDDSPTGPTAHDAITPKNTQDVSVASANDTTDDAIAATVPAEAPVKEEEQQATTTKVDQEPSADPAPSIQSVSHDNTSSAAGDPRADVATAVHPDPASVTACSGVISVATEHESDTSIPVQAHQGASSQVAAAPLTASSGQSQLVEPSHIIINNNSISISGSNVTTEFPERDPTKSQSQSIPPEPSIAVVKNDRSIRAESQEESVSESNQVPSRKSSFSLAQSPHAVETPPKPEPATPPKPEPADYPKQTPTPPPKPLPSQQQLQSKASAKEEQQEDTAPPSLVDLEITSQHHKPDQQQNQQPQLASSPPHFALTSLEFVQVEAIRKHFLAQVIASGSTVQSLFERHDRGQTKLLTNSQFAALMQELHFDQPDIALLWRFLDDHEDGTLAFEPFLTKMVSGSAFGAVSSPQLDLWAM